MKNIKITLPDHFLEEEVRSGYAVSTDVKKIWAVELDLLFELVRVCDKYGLKYYSDGGTTLGVLRHNGFIPWDDDIDIVMMREDYDKLCMVAKDEFKSPYFFQTSDSDPHFLSHHAKLRNCNTAAVTETDLNRKYNQGMWIDIFPLDNIPDDAEEMSRFLDRLHNIQSKLVTWRTWILRYEHKRGLGFFPFVRHFVKHLYCKYLWSIFNPANGICKEYDKSVSLYKDFQTSRIANLSMLWVVEPKKLYWKREWYDGERSGDFEFMKLPLPSEAEVIMKMQYGDWHKLVMGASCHQPKIFDAEKPYTEYTM